jgi:hypothetical protein
MISLSFLIKKRITIGGSRHRSRQINGAAGAAFVASSGSDLMSEIHSSSFAIPPHSSDFYAEAAVIEPATSWIGCHR